MAEIMDCVYLILLEIYSHKIKTVFKKKIIFLGEMAWQ